MLAAKGQLCGGLEDIIPDGTKKSTHGSLIAVSPQQALTLCSEFGGVPN